MRPSEAETVEGSGDEALRPRSYDRPAAEVFAACVRAAQELDSLKLAERDPRRGTISAYVRLSPLTTVPGPRELFPKKKPWKAGIGWYGQFDPTLAQGFLQVRLDPGPKGATVLHAHLRLSVPFATLLAKLLLKNYLRWVEIRLAEPRRA
ncbi:MAG: hypothetical protein LC624_11935 [Halobacteriales archaeon]|nr:hypothetical protein [Halobacteriales archaeon]